MKEEYGVNGDDKFLCDVVFDKVIEDRLVAPGSTDVGDVSHVVPTYQIMLRVRALAARDIRGR